MITERGMRYASLIDRVAGKGADAWKVEMAGAKLFHAGRDIIFLTTGNPDQAPPKAIIDATITSMQAYVGYEEVTGTPELREAIAARVARRTTVACAMENVVVVAGAQAGLYFALQCIAGPGDEVIVPEPMYATYEAVGGASGARLVNVPLRAERGFHLDLPALARAITDKTRVIWINSPNNPTGVVFTQAELDTIAALCKKNDLWLLSDEVYEDLAYAQPHISAWSLPGMQERTVVVSSLSKSCAIAGFRMGWTIGPKTLTPHLYNLLLCAQYGAPPFLQAGALVAVKDDLPEVAAMRDIYSRRATLLSDILEGAPKCRVYRPAGGMFVLLDIRGTGLGAEEFAFALLERKGVAVLPCDGFGPSAVGHIRMSLTTAETKLEEAGRRIVQLTRELVGQ